VPRARATRRQLGRERSPAASVLASRSASRGTEISAAAARGLVTTAGQASGTLTFEVSRPAEGAILVSMGPSRICGCVCAATVALLASACLAETSGAQASWGAFGSPQPVAIAGYAGSAEEPFITPDGHYLLFNSSEAQSNFSLQFASRVNAQSFEYQGPILGEGVNLPEALSGAPSLDDEGNLYFISNRSYFETRSTVYAGHFAEGTVTGVHLVPGVAGATIGKVDFDVGVSPNGSRLYVAVGQFGASGGPSSAALVIYDRHEGGFVIDPNSKKLLAAVNATGTLNYAADLSANELELFFTAASPALGKAPSIYIATRTSTSKPFGHVERIGTITAFAEAPSISADGTTLYYHEQVQGEFEIKTVTRSPGAPTVTKLSPKVGPVQGATPVTITGSDFTPASSVWFGQAQATDVNVVSEDEITALSPAGARGVVNVTVETPHGTSTIVPADSFSYRLR